LPEGGSTFNAAPVVPGVGMISLALSGGVRSRLNDFQLYERGHLTPGS
jgi:hypothetical protein